MHSQELEKELWIWHRRSSRRCPASRSTSTATTLTGTRTLKQKHVTQTHTCHTYTQSYCNITGKWATNKQYINTAKLCTDKRFCFPEQRELLSHFSFDISLSVCIKNACQVNMAHPYSTITNQYPETSNQFRKHSIFVKQTQISHISAHIQRWR